MITRILYKEEKEQYNSCIIHPVQTWEWGDFQESQGHKVYRLGVFEKEKIVGAYSVSFHRIPNTNFSIGTLLRGPVVDMDMIENVRKIAKDEKAVFVKFEPDVYERVFSGDDIQNFQINTDFPEFKISPKVAFYPYTFLIDLTLSEEKLLESMHPKTRYNIKVANRHGVRVEEKTSDQGFEIYLKLLFDTTRRQGFYLHTQKYHRDQWQMLKKTGIPHIMIASYQEQPLAAFMLFQVKDRLFYPYGASLDFHRETMSPTLLMWESILLGKKNNCKVFDMWGCLGPEAKEGDQGFGFHKFKQGYGGKLVQYMGTYDLVINPQIYQIYNYIDKYRWKLLRLKAGLLKK